MPTPVIIALTPNYNTNLPFCFQAKHRYHSKLLKAKQLFMKMDGDSTIITQGNLFLTSAVKLYVGNKNDKDALMRTSPPRSPCRVHFFLG